MFLFGGVKNFSYLAASPRKILIDNVIYIIRGDKIYSITGQEVR